MSNYKELIDQYEVNVYPKRDVVIVKGKDAKVWDENVDQMILELTYPKNFNREEIKYGYVRGREPYNYVKDIFERYRHYTRFVAN